MKQHIYIFLLIGFFTGGNFGAAFCQNYKVIGSLNKHEGEVQTIQFSPDGKYLASGGQFGKLMVWEVESQKQVYQIDAHKDRINDLSFQPSGKLLASASYDGLVKVWDMSTGNLHSSYANQDLVFEGHGSKVISFVVFHQNGNEILFGGDGGGLFRATIKAGAEAQTAKLVYTTVRKDIYERKVSDRITGGAWMPNGTSVVFCSRNTVFMVEVATGKVIQKMTYPKEWLNDVVAGPKQGQISVWSEDGMVNIWEVEKAEIAQQIPAGDYNDYSPISFNRVGTLLVAGASGKNANIWDVATGKKIMTLSAHKATVRVARFSPKTPDLVATGSYDGSIKLWKPEMPVNVIVSNGKDSSKQIASVIDTAVNKPSSIAPPSHPEEIAETELAIGKAFNIKSIQFEQGDHRLLPSSIPALAKIIAMMQKYPKMVIQIEGHTDNMGDAQKNLTLSHRRVTIVKNYLLERGKIEEKRIQTQAFGESKPIASNNTEETRKLNRRVEIRILDM